MLRRHGASEDGILTAQGNLASTYQILRRHEEAKCLRRDVYSGCLRIDGAEHERTITGANNYANSLVSLNRFEEAKALLRKTTPIASRVLGDSKDTTLKMRKCYAEALFLDAGATLDDLRQAVTTLEETARTARRVFGLLHPLTTTIEGSLRGSRATLAARETGCRVIFKRDMDDAARA